MSKGEVMSDGAKPPLRLLTVEEAAERLSLSLSTLRIWVWKRRIDTVRIGKSVRISEAVLDDLIRRGTRPAVEQRKKKPAARAK
jgi:excisionase family DNA binding protein